MATWSSVVTFIREKHVVSHCTRFICFFFWKVFGGYDGSLRSACMDWKFDRQSSAHLSTWYTFIFILILGLLKCKSKTINNESRCKNVVCLTGNKDVFVWWKFLFLYYSCLYCSCTRTQKTRNSTEGHVKNIGTHQATSKERRRKSTKI